MKNLIFSIVLITAWFTASGQVERKYNQFSKPDKFNIEFLNFASAEEGKTRLDVFIQVPFTEVLFLKNGPVFKGSYNLTVSVFDEDKEKLIVEKSWNENLEEKEFENTTSKDISNLSLRSFELLPGNYLVRSAFEDNESKNSFNDERVINVRDLSALAVSDVMLLAKLTQVKGHNKILPNVSKNVSAQKDSLPLFFEIYSDKKNKYEISYIVRDVKEKEIVTETKEIVSLDSGRNQVFYTLKNIDLSLGDFTLQVSLDDNNKVYSSNEKSFFSRWVGLPSTVKDLDKAIEQMVYIASGSEISEIKEAETEQEKIKLYQEYWKKKDPTPQTDENPVFEEYYRRVAYANENFSHYQEGWKTDRGMVFILLGSPNNIDRHPFEYNSKPYEVWEYYSLNKSFVFLDETGFGDYRLVTPLHGDLYRYR